MKITLLPLPYWNLRVKAAHHFFGRAKNATSQCRHCTRCAVPAAVYRGAEKSETIIFRSDKIRHESVGGIWRVALQRLYLRSYCNRGWGVDILRVAFLRVGQFSPVDIFRTPVGIGWKVLILDCNVSIQWRVWSLIPIQTMAEKTWSLILMALMAASTSHTPNVTRPGQL